jgi:hypothetical protein
MRKDAGERKLQRDGDCTEHPTGAQTRNYHFNRALLR